MPTMADLKIVQYPHPTLRYQSKPVKRVDSELRSAVARMFELMYEARGVGLAANQVDMPLQLFIVNSAGKPDEGEELVFINPVISRGKGRSQDEEGCLSLPGVYGPVTRPAQVTVTAYALDGTEINRDLDGLMARVVQHENDHLNGVLFIDRMADADRKQIDFELAEFELEFRAHRELGRIPADADIHSRLTMLEAKYCQTAEAS